VNPDRRRIAVTGAKGFLGSNLVLRLSEQGHDVRPITRETAAREAEQEIAAAEIIFHLAGANRCTDESEFLRSNRDYTAWLADVVARAGARPLIVYSSSAKAAEESAYGTSKRAGEDILLELSGQGLTTVSIWRLPNLCGKWSRPNYNSIVATFCHNAGRGEALPIDDPSSPLSLLYVDDLIDQWLKLIASPPQESGFAEPQKVHHTSVGEVADHIRAFAVKRMSGDISDVGVGLPKALYVSFIAALPVDKASYALDPRSDSRGSFVELFKTRASGQFSYFTARPGVTRGVGQCEWDGAAWPFATSQTLNALANVLRLYEQPYVTKQHYLDAVRVYAKCHTKNGQPYIGEYHDEVTGEWLKGDNPRSRYYNHSTFCDLVIGGLVGLVPRADDTIEVSPLLPSDAWDWFCLDRVLYHGHEITIVWDRTGQRYGRGAGLSVFSGATRIAHAGELSRVTGSITSKVT